MAWDKGVFGCPKCNTQVLVEFISLKGDQVHLVGQCPNPECEMECAYDFYEIIKGLLEIWTPPTTPRTSVH